MTEKEKAIIKLKEEINTDIDIAITMSKRCGLLELSHFIYYLRLTRLIHSFSNAKHQNKDILDIHANISAESYRYIISLIVKFGHWRLITDEKGQTSKLNKEFVQMFLKHVNLINAKLESEALIQIFDVQVFGERNRYTKIDMSKINTDKEIKRLFDYFLRIDEDNSNRKNSKKNLETLLKNFKNEYCPFSDLFEKEFGINVDEFCWLIEQLLQEITDAINLNQPNFTKLPNGNIDVNAEITFLLHIKCFLFDKKRILEKFDLKYHSVIKKLTFKAEDFDERQLRFHQLTRQPIIVKEQIIVLSPELILDSLFTNIHYSLLESSSIKNEYKDRQATLFLDKVAKIASQFGFIEFDRELDLYESKKQQLGDIDIILKNDSDFFLLIEAKNHALPMDIYFKDVAKTKEHLTNLQLGWEKKVKKRIEHLKLNPNKYSISGNYQYLIISRFPEVISHYSDLMVLSMQEFGAWLKKYMYIKDFPTFHAKHYESVKSTFTRQEILDLQKSNIFFGEFEEK